MALGRERQGPREREEKGRGEKGKERDGTPQLQQRGCAPGRVAATLLQAYIYCNINKIVFQSTADHPQTAYTDTPFCSCNRDLDPITFVLNSCCSGDGKNKASIPAYYLQGWLIQNSSKVIVISRPVINNTYNYLAILFLC